MDISGPGGDFFHACTASSVRVWDRIRVHVGVGVQVRYGVRVRVRIRIRGLGLRTSPTGTIVDEYLGPEQAWKKIAFGRGIAQWIEARRKCFS